LVAVILCSLGCTAGSNEAQDKRYRHGKGLRNEMANICSLHIQVLGSAASP
jgi:hypothetical protein